MELFLPRLANLPIIDVQVSLVIDGGVGQLTAVADLLNAEKIYFIGRSKGGDHSRNAEVKIVIPSVIATQPQFEKLELWKQSSNSDYKTLRLDSNSHIAKLIARLDDEAHRFAISYHTLLKRKKQIN